MMTRRVIEDDNIRIRIIMMKMAKRTVMTDW